MTFAVGDAVITSGANPAGHNRLPRYLRAKRGRVVAIRGRFPLADLRAAGADAPPEMLYTIAFEAREVWQSDAEPNAVLHADLWESYLERT
ncbi:MAG: SH3-like domain-containing protein [Candidatus Velthaea sp.]